MGGKQSTYRRALKAHEARMKTLGGMYTDDVLNGDMILICENQATGMKSNTTGRHGDHAFVNPAMLKGIQKAQVCNATQCNQTCSRIPA